MRRGIRNVIVRGIGGIVRGIGGPAAIALALSLGGCATTSENGNGNDIGLTGDATTISDDATSEPMRAPIPPREVSPFDEFRNILWSMDLDEESRRRQWDADRLRQEDMIAQCMNELGFEYVPYLDWMRLITGASEWQPDDPDWVAQYGFGTTTSPPGERGGSSVSATLDLGPNNDIIEELSPEGQIAWRGAFMGRGAGWVRNVGGLDYYDCVNWSQAVIWNEREVGNTEEFAPLMEAIAAMQNSLQWDLSDADRDWSSCMFDAGFPDIASPWQASDSVVRALNDLRSRLSLDPNWEYGDPTAENSPEFAALQAHEIELATTSLNCRVSTDYDAKQAAHRTEVENQFITDHRADLEALRAAAEQRN